MITITNIKNIDYAIYDEVWAIVRSLKHPGKMKHVPELSPSWELFKKYLNLRGAGKWNMDSFQKVYVPVFLREIQMPVARKKLAELIGLDKQRKHICMACFCLNETMCHRSIVAGILQHEGIQVHGIHGDYSQYGEAA